MDCTAGWCCCARTHARHAHTHTWPVQQGALEEGGTSRGWYSTADRAKRKVDELEAAARATSPGAGGGLNHRRGRGDGLRSWRCRAARIRPLLTPRRSALQPSASQLTAAKLPWASRHRRDRAIGSLPCAQGAGAAGGAGSGCPPVCQAMRDLGECERCGDGRRYSRPRSIGPGYSQWGRLVPARVQPPPPGTAEGGTQARLEPLRLALPNGVVGIRLWGSPEYPTGAGVLPSTVNCRLRRNTSRHAGPKASMQANAIVAVPH